MGTNRVIYLRPDDDEIADALAVAAARDLRSVNSYALAVIRDHLVKAGYLPKE